MIGVLPATFVFPTSYTEVWFPFDPDTASMGSGTMWVYARISRDRPVAATTAALGQALQSAGVFPSRAHVSLEPMSQSRMDPYSAGLVRATSVAVALVFLVLCANAAALMLTRTQRRRRLYALCAMLGAPWHRILRQAVLEQAVIVAGGVMGGLVLAWCLVDAAGTWLPRSLTFTSLNLLDLDMRAVAVAALLGGVSLLVCGVMPAWFGRRRYEAPHGDLVARGIGTERVSGRAPLLALVVQTALAILLCVGASVQWQSLVTMANVAPGIDAERLAWFDVKLPAAMGAAVVDRVKADPAVEDATVSYGAFPGTNTTYFADVITDGPTAAESKHDISAYSVTGDFFDVHGIDIVGGRALAATDAPDTVVISRSLARRLWQDGEAVGRTFRFKHDDRIFSVVGIASDVLNPMVDPREDDPEMYEVLPMTSAGAVERHLIVRCRQACGNIAALRQTIVDAAPGLRVSAGALVRDEYAAELARPRAAALLAGLFGVVGTGAAAIGLFVVLARAAASRQREYGIRLALGASPTRLAGQVGLTSARVIAGALIASALLAWPLGRVLSGIQHGTSISDPRAWAMAIAAVVIAAAAATLVPARQAARVDPVALLRHEG